MPTSDWILNLQILTSGGYPVESDLRLYPEVRPYVTSGSLSLSGVRE